MAVNYYCGSGHVFTGARTIPCHITVDLDAEKPASGLIAGDRCTAFDTGKLYVAAGPTTWVEQAQASALAAKVDTSDSRLSDARTPLAHSHVQGDVTGLTAALAAKSDVGHTHPGGSEAFPVGAVFIAVVSTSPATLLGYGTWSAFGAGRVLVGLDAGDPDFDTAEETGGAKTVTLTEAQIPAHTHVQNSHNHTQDAHTHQFLPRSATTGSVSSIVTGTLDTSSTISGANQPHVQSTTATNQAATAVNQNAGGGQAHSNVQPYIVVYFWKRTA